jgi:hypothetical protein
MATYKEKVGTSVVNYAGNYLGAVEGELWYDSTNKDFKYQYLNVSTSGSWRTGANLNTARNNLMGAGTQTAALKFGGRSPNTGATEAYNGTTWTTLPASMNNARSQGGGSGVQTSALAYAGETPDNTRNLTESWNNTAWSNVATLSVPRNGASGNAGVSNTSALCFGGGGPSSKT